MTSVIISNSTTTIESHAFAQCSGLTSIVIPESVENIGWLAFTDCSSLTSVTILNANPQKIIFTSYADLFGLRVNLSTATLYVPCGSKSAYEDAPVWQDFGTIIELSYSPITQLYPNIMNFTIALDGGEIQNGRLEIGAFSGNECRGTAVLQQTPGVAESSVSHSSTALQYAPAATQHFYLGFLSVYGNGDEDITFKVFDHNTGKEYEATIEPIAFAIDATYGSPEEPFQITIASSPLGNCKIQSDAVHIYPDSSGDKLIIQYPWSSIDQLEIIDLNGRIIWKETGFASEFVNVTSLLKGVYILKLVNDNSVSVYKFIKK